MSDTDVSNYTDIVFLFQTILRQTETAERPITVSTAFEGNDCMIKSQLGITIIFNLYVLPNSSKIVSDYLKAKPGDFTETEKWFQSSNNDEMKRCASLLRFAQLFTQSPSCCIGGGNILMQFFMATLE